MLPGCVCFGSRPVPGATMTESEWLSATDPTPLLEHIRRGSSAWMSARKRRLFVCACCRRIQRMLSQEDAHLLEAAERTADDRGRFAVLIGIREASAAAAGASRAVALAACRRDDFGTIRFAADQAVFAVSENWQDTLWVAEKRQQTALLRDLVTYPFNSMSLDPAWLTSTVLQLAYGIYEEKAFDRMPILADALQDAGCDNADILSHSRWSGPHVRGCHVIDLILGKC